MEKRRKVAGYGQQTELTKDQWREKCEALETQLEAIRERDREYKNLAEKRRGMYTRFLIKLLVGPSLHRQFRRTWDAWAAWAPSRPWPQEATRDLITAGLARVFRVGAMGVVLAVLPSAFLTIQTIHMSNQTSLMRSQDQNIKVQTETMVAQTEALDRQNRFIAFEQTTRFRDMMMTGIAPGVLELWPQPDPAIVSQFMALAIDEPEFCARALRPLLTDTNHQVTATVALIFSAMRQRLSSFTDTRNKKASSASRGATWSLRDAQLQYANLRNADLRGIDLRFAKLDGANLNGIDFAQANLRFANFYRAALTETNFQGADLEQTSLINADLMEANLEGANLKKAYLSEAELLRANLSRADLMSVAYWRNIKIIEKANIFGVKNAPEDFRQWALEHGAVELPPDEWEAFKANGYKRPNQETTDLPAE